ncbi:MFS transporter [Paenibacillus sp. GCM10012307]|uniref:MFS transporter n=1 Tax=Paenibacillus TaxID=44249 RepID=UPI002FCE29B0
MSRIHNSRKAWLIISSQSISIAGDSLLLMVLPLMILERTGSIFQVSLVFILTQVPVFLSFLSGLMRRYFQARTLIIVYDIVRFFILMIVSLFIYLDYSMILVYLMIFLFNIFSTLFRPTRMEFITYIVDKESLQKFNSLDRTFESAAYAIGFGIGGYAFFYLPLHLIFLLDSIPFLLAGIALYLLKTHNAANKDEPLTPQVKTSFWSTAKFINKHRLLSFLVYGEALAGLAFGIFMSLFVVYCINYLGASSIVAGHSEMILAFAATTAGILLSINIIKLSDKTLGPIGYLGMGVAMVLLGFNKSIWLTFLFVALIGIFNMFYSIAIRTLLQKNSRQEELIHVFAFESILSRAALIIGSGLAGIALDVTSLTVNWAILFSGVILILVSIKAFQVLYFGNTKLQEQDVSV